MDLAKVYEGTSVGSLGGYPEPEVKSNFSRRGKKFLKDSCKLAGVDPMKGYPSYNPGGIAVLGDVYCYIAHPSKDRRLEIILGESGPLYRTNNLAGGSYYGPNIWIGGYIKSGPKVLAEVDEKAMAEVIRKFLDGRLP